MKFEILIVLLISALDLITQEPKALAMCDVIIDNFWKLSVNFIIDNFWKFFNIVWKL